MPDDHFADPRLAALYDVIDGERDDLELYLDLVNEVAARRVLDVGCGTGSLACLLAGRAVEVIGVDPAPASLDVARRKPFADRVTWVHCDAAGVPPVDADLATMTGNAAQVFLSDESWLDALRGIRTALRPDGWLGFEVRDPERRAWEGWTPDATAGRWHDRQVGWFRTWTEVTEVRLPFVSFRHHFEFETDGRALTSESTLRFREHLEIVDSLERTGYVVIDVRDAPDRPGLELVFVARRDERGT